ncbi:MAG: hypothetical protein ACYTDX_11750, partial [Planctomycetota bacterium]
MIDAALVTVGAVLLAGLLASVWTSWREHEPRAAAILFAAALAIPAPYLGVGLASFDGKPVVSVVLLGLTAVAALVLLVPGGTPVLGGDDTPRGRIDERDIMFSRALLRPGSEAFREYYAANPDKK